MNFSPPMEIADTEPNPTIESKKVGWRNWRRDATKLHLLVKILAAACIAFLIWAILATAIRPRKKCDEPKQPNIPKLISQFRPKSAVSKYKHAAVVSDSGLCSEIGRNILILGGNAIDAGVAVTLCVGTVNFFASGLGGGAFINVYSRKEQKCTFINARETAPRQATQDMFVNDTEAATYGYLAAAIPGELHGLWTAFRLYGSKKILWSQIVEPVADLAESGFPITKTTTNYIEKNLKPLDSRVDIAHLKTLLTNPNSKEYYKEGEIVVNPLLGKTLRRLAKAKDPSYTFYRGDIAKEIIAEFSSNKGIIDKNDLAGFSSTVEEALVARIKNLNVCGGAPPSSFAITSLIPQILEEKYKGEKIEENSEFYHYLIEAQKFAYGLRSGLGDAKFSNESLTLANNLTAGDMAKWIAGKLRDESFSNASAYALSNDGSSVEDHGTSQICVVDLEGNALSITTTTNTEFGSKMLSPTLGIIWNNQMDDFSSPNMVNHWGYKPSPANFIVPGRRPMSSMSPTIVYDDQGKVVMVTGASGGSKIISATAQMLVRTLLIKQDIIQTIDSPRLHNQLFPYQTLFEKGFDEDIKEDLQKEHDQKNLQSTDGSIGVANLIVKTRGGGYVAASDWRRQSNGYPAGW